MKTTRRTRMATALATVLLAPSAALAQGSMTDGNVRWDFNNFPALGDQVDLEVPNGTDHASQAWWWYRILGDGQETMFPEPDFESYNGPSLTLGWLNVDGRGFSALVEGSIDDTTDSGGPTHVRLTLTIEKLSVGDLEIDIFTYVDLDMGGTFGDDFATTLSGNGVMFIQDSSSPVAVLQGVKADFWEIAAWPNLRDSLTDGGFTFLCNCVEGGGGFGPGNFSGAFNWFLQLVPSGCTERFMTLITIDRNHDGCFGAAGDCCSDNGTPGCDDFDCCLAVGACDPFCIDGAWDGLCAGEGVDGTGCGAKLLCDVCPGSDCWTLGGCPSGPSYHPRPYGDVTPFGFIFPPCTDEDRTNMGDGFANMLDVFCAFNAFNDGFPYTQCPCADVAPCGGDSFVNMQDVFAIFSAFNDNPACSAPCP